MEFETRCVREGEPKKDAKLLSAAVSPISLGNAKHIPVLGDYKEYTKEGTTGGSTNEVVLAFEQKMASLENCKYGLAFPSGSQVVTAYLMGIKSDEHVLVIDDVYGGTQRYFRKIVSQVQHTDFTFADFTDPEVFKSSFKENTKLLWMESPTNPTLKITDFEFIISEAKKRGCVVVVDNTFASCYNQQPVSLGADAVMHSCTKYVGGHSDVLMGVFCTNRKDIHDKLYEIRNVLGAVANPFECYMCYRGLKTLAVRMEQHGKNAQELAQYLQAHPHVESVNYPGLPTHKYHDLCKKYMRTGGGMLTFVMKGTLEQAKTFFKAVKLGILAESLGAVETLLEIPALMTHASVPPEFRKELGIHDTLIRVSVGVEDIEDLKADFDQALKVACGPA